MNVVFFFLQNRLWKRWVKAVQKDHRLSKREDFGKVYRRGKSCANRQFVLYHLANPAGAGYRLGISVSKKIGVAVVRNRIRRMVKEIVRLNGDRIEGSEDFILIARKPVLDLSYEEMEKSVLHVLKRGGLLQKPARPDAAKPSE